MYILVTPPTVQYLGVNLLFLLILTILCSRPAQPVAREQPAARDTALFLPAETFEIRKCLRTLSLAKPR